MLQVLLRAVVAAREREDQRVVAQEFAECADCARVIGQLVVGENASGHNIRTHDSTPPMSPWVCVCWHIRAFHPLPADVLVAEFIALSGVHTPRAARTP